MLENDGKVLRYKAIMVNFQQILVCYSDFNKLRGNSCNGDWPVLVQYDQYYYTSDVKVILIRCIIRANTIMSRSLNDYTLTVDCITFK